MVKDLEMGRLGVLSSVSNVMTRVFLKEEWETGIRERSSKHESRGQMSEKM